MRTRALDLAALAHDASHYLLHPTAVAVPRDPAQVAAVMAVCRRAGVPLTFRSGGTSLSGQAQTDGVLVDVRHHFSGRPGTPQIEVLDDGARVRVPPGVTVRAVNARLAPYRRRIGPDPASEGACTLGGVIADNSSGMQCGTAQSAYATVESLVVVLASGTVVDTADPDAARHLAAAEPALHAGLLRLRDAVRDDAEATATIRRLFAIKNTMGYAVNAFLDADEPVDLLRLLMVGSEGTLGFVTSAVLRTVPVLPHAATGLLVFGDLAGASARVPEVLATGVATAELLDAAALRVAATDPACPAVIRDLTGRGGAGIGGIGVIGGRAALLVELQASSAEELAEARHGAEAGFDALGLAEPVALTDVAAERAALWRIRKGLFSAVAGARPAGTNALLEDVAVPVAALGDLATGLVGLFGAHDYDGSVIFGHARDGNLHFLLNERFDSPPALRRYEAFTEEMVDLVLGLGGTLKAEHGTGRIMAPFVERQYGPALTGVMREVRALFDPTGLLNPGSVLTDDDRLWLRDLKTSVPVEEEVDRCVECGFCEPVCPSRAITLTPRQRIVARREIAAARAAGDPASLARAEAIEADYGYDGVDTCAADGLCATACPVLIDTGALVRRLRAETGAAPVHRAWSAAAGHWDAMTRTSSIGLSALDRVPSALRPGRLDGVGAGGPRRADVVDPGADVVWFGSCVGTMFGGGAAASFAALCAAAGVRLRTPAGLASLCCGTPWKSKGHRAGWERMREQVVPALLEATQGPDGADGGRLPVVVEASSCAEGLGLLVADAGLEVVDALDVVADRVLPRLDVAGLTRQRRRPRAVVHPTCSSTALGSTDALVRLAGAVADDVVVPTTWGCCGFAGDRGVSHPELTASATAPEAAEVAGLDDVPGTVYVSGNRTCEIGLTRATGQPYRHVLEVLAEVTLGAG